MEQTVHHNSTMQGFWLKFTRFIVKIFYRKCEIAGLEHFPDQGPVIICANHTNALADALIIQSVLPRIIHPIARSGLFKNPLLRPILLLIQAIPIYRRKDPESNTEQNVDSFQQCYDMIQKDGVLLIFPEGQSHSDSKLRDIKTGVSRIALLSKQKYKTAVLLPVGLDFSCKGKFREDVLVNIGKPIEYTHLNRGDNEDDVHQLTEQIQVSLEQVTINTEDKQEREFLESIEHFFSLRHEKYRGRSMELRFRTMRKLVNAHNKLQSNVPEKVESIRRHLQQFERLCSFCGAKDYYLIAQYNPTLITRFIFRSLTIIFILLPLALYGFINSFIPFLLTRHTARLITAGTDQYDTAKMLLGLFLFPVFWGGQTYLISNYTGITITLLYMISLPLTALAALMFRREKEYIFETLRVFVLFLRKKKLKQYLESRRRHLEKELAHLVRLTKKIPSANE